MKQLKNTIEIIKNRWKSTTPSFFKNIIRIGLSISGVSLAIHGALMASGAIEPQWWVDIYPYLIAIPDGMTATVNHTCNCNNHLNIWECGTIPFKQKVK